MTTSLPPPAGPRESLLVFSDVHLGSDLNDHGPSPRRSHDIDRDLGLLLQHYAATGPTTGERWRVVIAGDFIDFIGITIDSATTVTELTAEERAHGLGSAEDHTRVKLQRVATRHVGVFDALAEMLLKGHALTMVHGNHDADFHWDGVKNDFRDLLLARARVVDAGLDEAAFRDQITFEPWFFYWKNVAYIEHGHQYDTYCATDHLMAPVSPLDPRRLMAGFSGIMLRHVVRHTVGMTEHGHETRGVLDYLAFGARLGLRGLAGLTASFARACAALFRLRAVHFSSAAQAIRTEHERRIVAFGEATRYSAARLRALASLQVEPITRTIRGIMKSVLLDRIALGAASLLALFVVGVAAIFRVQALYGAILVVVAWVATHLYLSLSRTIDPAEEMILRASRVAKVFPTAFVIMGHTHLPVERLLDDGVSTYINLGSWAEDEPPATETPRHAPYTAARTHLVIEMEGEQPRAELRAWAPGGPRKYRA